LSGRKTVKKEGGESDVRWADLFKRSGKAKNQGKTNNAKGGRTI